MFTRCYDWALVDRCRDDIWRFTETGAGIYVESVTGMGLSRVNTSTREAIKRDGQIVTRRRRSMREVEMTLFACGCTPKEFSARVDTFVRELFSFREGCQRRGEYCVLDGVNLLNCKSPFPMIYGTQFGDLTLSYVVEPVGCSLPKRRAIDVVYAGASGDAELISGAGNARCMRQAIKFIAPYPFIRSLDPRIICSGEFQCADDGEECTFALAVPYEGQVNSYPIIELHGPMDDPSVLINGNELAFDYSVRKGEVVYIDINPSYRKIWTTYGGRLSFPTAANWSNYLVKADCDNTLDVIAGGFLTGSTRVCATYYDWFEVSV